MQQNGFEKAGENKIEKPNLENEKKIEEFDGRGESQENPENSDNPDKKAELLDAESQFEALDSELKLVEKGIRSGQALGIESPELLEKQAGILSEIERLEEKKAQWLEKNGKEELPEKISVSEGKNDSVVRLNLDKDQEANMTEKQRREVVDQWKENVTEFFSNVLQSNWRTRNAVNLPLVLDMIAKSTPLAIEKRSKKFLEGSSDSLPDFTVMSWKTNSIFERLSGKPNQIRELSLDFGGEKEILAKESELTLEEEAEPKNQEEFKQAA